MCTSHSTVRGQHLRRALLVRDRQEIEDRSTNQQPKTELHLDTIRDPRRYNPQEPEVPRVHRLVPGEETGDFEIGFGSRAVLRLIPVKHPFYLFLPGVPFLLEDRE